MSDASHLFVPVSGVESKYPLVGKTESKAERERKKNLFKQNLKRKKGEDDDRVEIGENMEVVNDKGSVDGTAEGGSMEEQEHKVNILI